MTHSPQAKIGAEDSSAIYQAQILALQAELNALREDRRELLKIQDEYEYALEDLRVHQEELRTQNETLLMAQAEIDQLNDSYQQLFEYAPIGYLVLDDQQKITQANVMACQLLATEKSRLYQHGFAYAIDARDRKIMREVMLNAMQTPGQAHSFQVQTRHQTAHQHLQVDVLFDGKRYKLSLTNITQLVHLQQHYALTTRILEEMHEGVMLTDEQHHITFTNRAFSEVTGYTAAEVLGQSPGILSSGKHDQHFYAAMWARINQAGLWRGEIWNKRKNGEVYAEWLTISRLHDNNTQRDFYLAVFSDISDRKYSELKLIQMAQYDSLTNLPNRLLLRERIQQAIAMAKRERSHAIVLFIDLDKFKKVNDVYGHQEGDWVLKIVSTRMAECLRGVDTLARLGGDEFAVVLAPPTNELEAVMIGERLIQQCERPLVSSKNTYHIGASVGMAIYPEDGGDIDTLLRNADIAMYQVKRQGRGFVTRYQHDQSTQIEHRNRMEILLRAALEQQKVRLLYQPQVYALDGRLAGFEALVRILDEQGNFVSPADFIPVAEETGLIKQLTQQIIQLAIAQQRSWCQMPNVELVKVSINLSVYQIRDREFGQHLLDQLADSGLMPACIGVEVTESEAIEHYDEAVRLLSRLRAAGLTVAIDDFGAGYSSLTHLKNLPVDVLKVDKAFIDDVPGDTNGENLVQSVLALAKSLQLTVIAEGVEREEQLNWLRGQRCEIIQGYIYAPPVSAEQATEWLKSRYATR